jgi:hypothetical protein
MLCKAVDVPASAFRSEVPVSSVALQVSVGCVKVSGQSLGLLIMPLWS